MELIISISNVQEVEGRDLEVRVWKSYLEVGLVGDAGLEPATFCV